MKTLLVINSSPSLAQSHTRRLLQQFREAYQDQHPDMAVLERDLAQTPPPHLDALMISGFFTPVEQHSEEQAAALRLSDSLVEELESADTIVIGAPMHNFAIPSSLKAYLDHVIRAGRTFRYSENGPQGLLNNKQVYVVTARGGRYSEGPMAAMDHQTGYLKTVLSFIGLDDVTFVHAEGMAKSGEALDRNLMLARQQIQQSIEHHNNAVQ